MPKHLLPGEFTLTDHALLVSDKVISLNCTQLFHTREEPYLADGYVVVGAHRTTNNGFYLNESIPEFQERMSVLAERIEHYISQGYRVLLQEAPSYLLSLLSKQMEHIDVAKTDDKMHPQAKKFIKEKHPTDVIEDSMLTVHTAVIVPQSATAQEQTTVQNQTLSAQIKHRFFDSILPLFPSVKDEKEKQELFKRFAADWCLHKDPMSEQWFCSVHLNWAEASNYQQQKEGLFKELSAIIHEIDPVAKEIIVGGDFNFSVQPDPQLKTACYMGELVSSDGIFRIDLQGQATPMPCDIIDLGFSRGAINLLPDKVEIPTFPPIELGASYAHLKAHPYMITKTHRVLNEHPEIMQMIDEERGNSSQRMMLENTEKGSVVIKNGNTYTIILPLNPPLDGKSEPNKSEFNCLSMDEFINSYQSDDKIQLLLATRREVTDTPDIMVARRPDCENPPLTYCTIIIGDDSKSVAAAPMLSMRTAFTMTEGARNARLRLDHLGLDGPQHTASNLFVNRIDVRDPTAPTKTAIKKDAPENDGFGMKQYGLKIMESIVSTGFLIQAEGKESKKEILNEEAAMPTVPDNTLSQGKQELFLFAAAFASTMMNYLDAIEQQREGLSSDQEKEASKQFLNQTKDQVALLLNQLSQAYPRPVAKKGGPKLREVDAIVQDCRQLVATTLESEWLTDSRKIGWKRDFDFFPVPSTALLSASAATAEESKVAGPSKRKGPATQEDQSRLPKTYTPHLFKKRDESNRPDSNKSPNVDEAPDIKGHGH